MDGGENDGNRGEDDKFYLFIACYVHKYQRIEMLILITIKH